MDFPRDYGIIDATSVNIHYTINKKDSMEEVPLWLSGLRIQHCHCSRWGGCCGTGSIPGLRTSMCYRYSKKKKKKKKSKQASKPGVYKLYSMITPKLASPVRQIHSYSEAKIRKGGNRVIHFGRKRQRTN